MTEERCVSVAIGSTFLEFGGDSNGLRHLHLVASSVKEPEVVVLNVTTMRSFSDKSCTLDVGDHPFIKHLSCVSYPHAQFRTVATIEAGLLSGDLIPHEPFRDDVMQRIWDGASNSRRLTKEFKVVLKRQGAITHY